MLRRFLTRFKPLAAGLLILGSPASVLVEAVEHAMSGNQSAHATGAHFEGKDTRAHSDHCVAGRTIGDDRLSRGADEPNKPVPAECFLRTGAPALAVAGDDAGTNHSRAPPASRV